MSEDAIGQPPRKTVEISRGAAEIETKRKKSAPKSKMKEKAMKPPEAKPYLKEHWRIQGDHPPLPPVSASVKEKVKCDLCPKASRLSCLTCNERYYCSIK